MFEGVWWALSSKVRGVMRTVIAVILHPSRALFDSVSQSYDRFSVSAKPKTHQRKRHYDYLKVCNMHDVRRVLARFARSSIWALCSKGAH